MIEYGHEPDKNPSCCNLHTNRTRTRTPLDIEVRVCLEGIEPLIGDSIPILSACRQFMPDRLAARKGVERGMSD